MRLLPARKYSPLALLLFLGFPATVAAQIAARIEIHSFQAMTLTDQQFLIGSKTGQLATIGGELRLPRRTGRFPAVILVHGSGGVGANADRWAQELNRIGVAAFIMDSFTGRGIVETVTDQSRLGTLAMIADAYGALAVLTKHPRIEPTRIAVMGFSKGGHVALYASLKRFQKMYGPPSAEFAAFIPFYANCNNTYRGDTEVNDHPIRIFHGAADDYVPVGACQEYVKRLRSAGKDVELTIYDGAHHSFDNPAISSVELLPDAQVRSRECLMQEDSDGQLINLATHKPFTFGDACIERGAHIGYDERATTESTKAVKEFLTSLWNLP